MLKVRVMKKVESFVMKLKPRTLFGNSEVMHLGGRHSVDTALARLVKAGILTRIAHGIYVRFDRDQSPITLPEIAEFKARMSKIEITDSPIASRLADPNDPTSVVLTYATNGNDSNLKTIYGTIRFRRVSARKFNLANNEEGRLLFDLWEKGPHVEAREVALTLQRIGRRDQDALAECFRLLPSRMRDAAQKFRRIDCRPSSVIRPASTNLVDCSPPVLERISNINTQN